MQRLVAVRLRHRDEVTEAPIERLVERMHRPERVVAMHDRIDHDAEPIHVHDLGERFLFGAHLGVDAVGGLDPADDAMRNVLRGEPRFERSLDPAHRLATVAEHGADARRDDPVSIGIQRAETEILQLGLEAVHAEALGDRRVDLERLERDAAA